MDSYLKPRRLGCPRRREQLSQLQVTKIISARWKKRWVAVFLAKKTTENPRTVQWSEPPVKLYESLT